MLQPLFLLTMKPTMYVANVAEGGFHDNPLLAQVEAHAAKEGAPVVAVCASSSPVRLTTQAWGWTETTDCMAAVCPARRGPSRRSPGRPGQTGTNATR